MRPLLAAVLAWFAVSAASALEPVSLGVEPSPGTYEGPVTVKLQAAAGSTVRYRFLESSSDQSFAWPGALTLEALAGETRTYTLRLSELRPSGESSTRDYRFVVRGRAGLWPSVTPAPGTFPSSVSVRPVLPPGWTLEGFLPDASGAVTLDTPVGTRHTFVLALRGPLGQSTQWAYTVDRRDQEVQSLEILSPSPGQWANAQTLVAAFRGVDRVLWSYGSQLDPATAQEYRGPVVLDRGGSQTITVSARSRKDGQWLVRTVSWRSGSAAPPHADWPAAGVQPLGISVPEVPGWTVSWDEGRSWQASAAFQEGASTQSRRVLTLLARRSSEVHRYVYWLDSRAALAPELEFTGGWNPSVVFSGEAEVFHRVVWTLSDGSQSEGTQGLWGPWGSWKVPDGAVAATVIGFTAGDSTEPATLGFPETGWSVPEWEPWDTTGPQADRRNLPLGGRVPSRPGFRPVYEVSSTPSVPEPSASSPVLDGVFLPTVPWGCDRTFSVRFAWRDESGLIGPAGPALTLRVDRVPPGAPEVLEVPGQVIVRAPDGEEEGTSLVWAVTVGRVPSADGLTFQPYRAALDTEALRSGSSQDLWLHAQALDPAGNQGPARLNFALSRSASAEAGGEVVQVDPDPTVGETPVQDGGIYAWSSFRLRPLDQGRELWVGVTEASSGLPQDWARGLEPWAGVVSRAVGPGDRKTFLVYWNVKQGESWGWPQPSSLKITLDRSAPDPVVPTDPWPTEPLGSAWTLDLEPGRTGDQLWYSYTLDGTPPPDPLKAGQPWPGIQTWDAPPLGRVVVRLRVAAVSVSGLSREMPLGGPVVIDRTPPAAAVPALPPFTYRTGPLTVPLPPGAFLVRYSLSSDGSPPAVPGPDSPRIPEGGMVLPGEDQKSVLYRFRWRAYSQAGLPGPVSDTFSVVVDRVSSPDAAASGAPAGPPVADPPRISGLPASGISAAAVTLRAEWAAGLLRYEVSEGIGVPAPVTQASSPWQGSLTLDGGPGVDRTFVVAVRGFSPTGAPLTPEQRHTIRIDRSAPAVPEVALEPNRRRPEASLRLLTAPNPEEVLHYRWVWESFPEGQGEGGWTTLTSGAPVFVAPRGALTRLRVEAYLRDEAGNEGPKTEAALLVDQNVVYVASGGAEGDGSRDRPLTDLAGAVDKMHREGKGLLFVAAGTYAASRTLDLGGIEAYGGWDPELWEASPLPGRSLWTAQTPFQGSAFLESVDRDWSLNRIDLASGASPARTVWVRGGQVSVRTSSWTLAPGASGWDQTGGRLGWTDVTAVYQAAPQGSFLVLEGVEATLTGLSLSATQNRGGVLFSQKTSQVLVRNLSVVSKKASGYDAVWASAGGVLTMDGVRILAGEGAARAAGFILKDTRTQLGNAEVALYAEGSNTGLQVTGGRLDLVRSSVSLLRGQEFNQTLVLSSTSASLRTFALKVESGSYQGGLTMEGGSLILSGGRVSLAGGGQRAWGGQFLGECRVDWDGVNWVLARKTPGEPWKAEQPWAPGSTVVNSPASGW